MSRVRRSLIPALNPASGEAVVILGWVYRLRVLAKTTFIIVKDCTGEGQCVAATESLRDLRLQLDDAVEIHGVAQSLMPRVGTSRNTTRSIWKWVSSTDPKT
jgi:nondiscriminating aspartyl-tRNA synthetase